MFFMKRFLPIRQEKEMEILKAKVEKQRETIENQKVTIQYLAAMTDVYIPEETEEDEDVQNFIENEEIARLSEEKIEFFNENGGTGKGTWKTYR